LNATSPDALKHRRVTAAAAVSNMTSLDAKYEYEYLVKYKNLSYLHIQWLSGAEIGKKVSDFFAPTLS
jgi:hypothetical protein